MATSKNVAKVNSVNNEQVTMETILEKLATLDEKAHAEKQELLGLFIEKAANVLENEKKTSRLNTCYARLCKMHDKKLAKQFVSAFTVLSSEWQKDSKGKLYVTANGGAVRFTKDNNVPLMSCNDIDAFCQMWAYHRQAMQFMHTNLLPYVSSVKVEKQAQSKGVDAIKKAIATMYKGADLDGKKFLSDIMRQYGIDIPTA